MNNCTPPLKSDLSKSLKTGPDSGQEEPGAATSLPGRSSATASTDTHGFRAPCEARGFGLPQHGLLTTPEGDACGRRPVSEAASRAPSAAAPPPAGTRQPLGHAGTAGAEPGIECHLPLGSHEPPTRGHPREEGAPRFTLGPETQMPTHHPAEQRPATAAPRRPAESTALEGKSSLSLVTQL